VEFDFHGNRVSVECDSAEVLDRVGRDFHFFRSTLDPDDDVFLTIVMHMRPPEYGELPALDASIYTPRNITYTEGDTSYIDYFGRAIAVYDRTRNHVEVSGDGVSLLHEIAYLTILSRVGSALDRQGLHRVHALAVGREKHAALFLMPSGCGKSTLGLGLMSCGAGFDLVSDDTPLITRSGKVLPFPLRIGVLGGPPPGIPEQHVRFMERMEFAPKYLVSVAAFEESLAHGELQPELVFLGERSLGPGCRIRRAGFLAGFGSCVRHMIVGVGVYQGLEFMLRSSIRDLVKSVPTIVSRTIGAISMLARARIYRLQLGREPNRNVETIAAFLERELNGKASSEIET
jgi:hypothetical protein